MRLSELIGLDVHTESGDHIGHIHDVRGELTPRTLKVTGLVVGRALLYPPDGDVAAAVDIASGLVHGGAR